MQPGSFIEDQAYDSEPDEEDARAYLDWGDPGKNHRVSQLMS